MVTNLPDIQHSENPLNREPSTRRLIESGFITEDSVAYDRNHSAFPEINEKTHYVQIDGAVGENLRLSIEQLRDESRFEQREVITSLQCAGNRRKTMSTELGPVNGILWQSAALMNGRWKGPLLRDVLLAAGVTDEARQKPYHVAFSCYHGVAEDDWYYGGSVELSRVMDPQYDIILALEFNGKPLTKKHGFPVRAVLPGIIGARWVKWLDRVTVQQYESNNYYQKRDYKLLPPEITTHEQAAASWDLYPAMQQMPINSMICTPEPGDVVKPNSKVVVQGYAVPHEDDGPVEKVEICLDENEWQDATIMEDMSNADREKHKWSWVRWKAEVDVGDGRAIKRILCRARDKGGNIQKNDTKWTYRGVGYNRYGEVKILVTG